MALPTIDKPKIKYLGKTRKGIPVYMWVKTYFEFNERMNQWTQKQEWSKEKPDEKKLS